MKHYKKLLLLFLTPLFLTCTLSPPVKDNIAETTTLPRQIDSDEPALLPVLEPEAPQIEVPQIDYLTIIAVGDNLYHDVMIAAGEQGDYESVYSEIRTFVESADIAFINQETLLGGRDFGFSGYPQFNSPQALGRAIQSVGFNVVNHATNHIMDKGERAVFVTMDFWDNSPETTVLGIHRSAEERSMPTLVEKNNFTIGFLSYTYGTNGLPVPRDKPYLVSLINTAIMANEIDALRPLCDLLVVSMHWGEEYQHNYSREQERLAAFLAEHQVDLVIGHHPHVIQPIEYIARPDGKNMLCFYSLGNFISAQVQNPTILGAMAYIKLERTRTPSGETADIIFSDAGAIPLVAHFERGYTNFKVYPLYAYTEELIKKHYKNQWSTEITLNYFDSLAESQFGNRKIMRNPFE